MNKEKKLAELNYRDKQQIVSFKRQHRIRVPKTFSIVQNAGRKSA